MAITSPPSITELPTAPERGDRTTFRSRAEMFIGALPVFVDEVSAVGSNVYNNANETHTNSVTAAAAAATATTAASDAEAARDIAQAAGNLQGDWSGLTGSLSIGAAVSHDGRLWVAVTAITDVTLSEPSVSNSDWVHVTPASYLDVSKSSGYTVVPGDDSKIITCTASMTLTFSSAANLREGWSCYVKNASADNVTLDPSGAETIDGVTSGTVEPGDIFFIRSDGVNLKCEKIYGRKPHYITASQTWTCPAGISTIFVQMQAAGGGGGSGGSTFGSGGSGGGYAEKLIPVSAGASKTITIGIKGAKAASSNTSGGNAGASSFDTDITCTGGYGGTTSYSSQQTSVGAASGGDINIKGGLPKVQPTSSYAGEGGGSFFGSGNYYFQSNQINGYIFGVGGAPGKTDVTAGDGGVGICIIWY